MNYRQCLLKKGYRETMAWIPEYYARLNYPINIKNDNGIWEDGWLIKGIYGSKDEKYILEHERDYILFDIRGKDK